MNYVELMDWDIPVAIAVIKYGNVWKVEKTNTEFARLFGYEGESAEGIDEDSLVLDKDTCVLEEMMEQAVRTHQVVIQEIRIVRQDHRVCWTEVRCNHLAHVNAVPYLMLMFWYIH